METVAYKIIDIRQVVSVDKGLELRIAFLLPVRLGAEVLLKAKIPYIDGIRPTQKDIDAAMVSSIKAVLPAITETAAMKVAFAEKLEGTLTI